MELEEHLFRRESGRLVSALTRILGIHNLALAEDVVQDAFVRALEVWRLRGLPDNPSAWLMTTAKNRALDLLRRERTARTLGPELGRRFEDEASFAPVIDEAFGGAAIRDEQLRMMISCCDPRQPHEVQVALVLNILCGFSAGEIAAAFLTGRSAIEKRIARGKSMLASARLFDLTDRDFSIRLATVRHALYLLFNEGYHGGGRSQPVKAELCGEAIRLTAMLIEHPPAATPETYALSALMHLHAARLPARIDPAGDLFALGDQDRSKWDPELLADGLDLLERSAAGEQITAYHLEAAIAAAHASAARIGDTDWATIVSLYDRLIEVAPSPIVSLNRAIALAERDGPERGIEALRTLPDRDRLAAYPFYEAAMGELELRLGHFKDARRHFTAALEVARNDAERRFLKKRWDNCK